jgi:TubC N-terminal docking domain
MNPSAIVRELSDRGIKVKPKGDKLLYYPMEAMTPELLLELSEHKAILMQMYTPRNCLVCGRVIVGEHHYLADGLRRCERCYNQWTDKRGIE